MLSVRNDVIWSATLATSATKVLDLSSPMIDLVSISVVYTDATTAGKTFSRLSGNSCTMTAHGQVTGSLGQCTTTSSLPTGLSTSTNYFLIIIDVNTVQFASSLANAVAGTAVALSGAGSGVQTFTPTATGSNVFKLQQGNDGVAFQDISGDTVTIAGGGNKLWDLQFPGYRYVNMVYTPSAGTTTFKVTVYGKIYR